MREIKFRGKPIEDVEDYEVDTRNLSFLARKYTLEIIGNIHDEVSK
jgi:hypothetical protein